MHMGVYCVWLDGGRKSWCFCFCSPLTARLMQVVFLGFSCVGGWLADWLCIGEKAGRECSCRRFHSRAEREGLGALLGRAGGDNFRWNHAGLNGASSLIAVCLICLITLEKAVTIIPTLFNQDWNTSCVGFFLGFSMLWWPARLFPKLWLMSPEPESCKVKPVSPTLTSGCVAPLHLHLTSVLSLYLFSLRVWDKKKKQPHNPNVFHSNTFHSHPVSASYLLISHSLCLHPPHLSGSV